MSIMIMEKALKALDLAKHGLVWYATKHPEDVDENDEAAALEIDEAERALSAAIEAAKQESINISSCWMN